MLHAILTQLVGKEKVVKINGDMYNYVEDWSSNILGHDSENAAIRLARVARSRRVEVLSLAVRRSAIGLIQHRLSTTSTESSIVCYYSLASLGIIIIVAILLPIKI